MHNPIADSAIVRLLVELGNAENSASKAKPPTPKKPSVILTTVFINCFKYEQEPDLGDQEIRE